MQNTDAELDYEEDEEDENVTSEPADKKIEEKHVFEAEMKMKYVGHRNAR